MAESSRLAEISQAAGSVGWSAISTSSGQALFSTNFGERPPRRVTDSIPSIIVRSQAVFDAQIRAEHYLACYPKQCRNILHDFRIEDWFDDYDICLNGAQFLGYVLFLIATKNTIDMDVFNVQWSADNRSKLPELCDPVTLESVFTDAERSEYGDIFLNCALTRMRHALWQLAQEQGKIPESADPLDQTTWSELDKPRQPASATEEAYSTSDPETASDVRHRRAERRHPRRASFHGVSAIPKDELAILKTRNVVAEATAVQPNQSTIRQSSGSTQTPRPHGPPLAPQRGPANTIPRTTNVAPSLLISRVGRPENPARQHPPGPTYQDRAPSSNLRMQVMEGSEPPSGTPAYYSLIEAVHHQGTLPSQFPQGAQPSGPIAYALEGQVMVPPGRISQPAAQPSPYAPGLQPLQPRSNHPTGQSPSQQVTPSSISVPVHSRRELYVESRYQDPHSYGNDAPQPYVGARFAPVARQSPGAWQEQNPTQWRSPYLNQELASAQMQRGAGAQQSVQVVYHPEIQGQVYAHQENVPPQQFYRNRSDSTEPFPTFHDPSAAQASQPTDLNHIGQISARDFACTPTSIGRLREDVHCLWVSDFPDQIDETALKHVFGRVARVYRVLMKQRRTVRYGTSRFAFVDFPNTFEAKKALAAANRNDLQCDFPIQVRVPEQFHNMNHDNFIPPTVLATDYQGTMRGEHVSQPGYDMSSQRPFNAFRTGRGFGGRRSFGFSGRQHSMGSQTRTDRPWTRTTHGQYSLQDARSGASRRSTQSPADRPSEEVSVVGTGPDNRRQNTGQTRSGGRRSRSWRSNSLRSSGPSTPKRTQQGQNQSETFTESPLETRTEASFSSARASMSSQTPRTRGSGARGPGPTIVSDSGAAAIIEEPGSIEEQSKVEDETVSIKSEIVPVVDESAERTSKSGLDSPLKVGEDGVTRRGDDDGTENRSSSPADTSCVGASPSIDSGDIVKSSAETASSFQPESALGLTASTSSVATASPIEATLHLEEDDHDKQNAAATGNVKEAETRIVAKSPSDESKRAATKSEATLAETQQGHKEKSAEALVPEQEPPAVIEPAGPGFEKVQSGQEAAPLPSEANVEPTIQVVKADSSTQKQGPGPAQTESLSPFGRRRPSKAEAKKSGKKKKKSRGKGKGRELSPAPDDAPPSSRPGSSGGSRAVSSESYHTADEPESSYIEEGKSDAISQEISDSSSSSRTVSAIPSPMLPMKSSLDDIPAMEQLESFDGVQDQKEIEAPAESIAEQQDGHARADVAEASLTTTITDKETEARGTSSEQQLIEMGPKQIVPALPTLSKRLSSSQQEELRHVTLEQPQQAGKPSLSTEPVSTESGAVFIETRESHKSTSTSPSKRKPAPLELADITNVSSTSTKFRSKEEAPDTSEPSELQDDAPASGPSVSGVATTPTSKKKKNKKKKRSSGATIAGQPEDSPASAEYVTPSTSYPPLHQASSTTVVGLGAPKSPQAAEK